MWVAGCKTLPTLCGGVVVGVSAKTYSRYMGRGSGWRGAKLYSRYMGRGTYGRVAQKTLSVENFP